MGNIERWEHVYESGTRVNRAEAEAEIAKLEGAATAMGKRWKETADQLARAVDRERETLRNLWRLSQGDRMIIRIADEIQDAVMAALGTEEPGEAERILFGGQ